MEKGLTKHRLEKNILVNIKAGKTEYQGSFICMIHQTEENPMRAFYSTAMHHGGGSGTS